jgi:hypothetical protein
MHDLLRNVQLLRTLFSKRSSCALSWKLEDVMRRADPQSLVAQGLQHDISWDELRHHKKASLVTEKFRMEIMRAEKLHS